MSVVHVAVGVILNPERCDEGEGQGKGKHEVRVLLAKRPAHTHQGGLWEFPGGKVDSGESVTAALTRELEEELAIRVEVAEPLIEIRHDYPDKSVLLDVWVVSQFSGQAKGNEGQPIEWAPVGALSDYEFPAANIDIVAAVQARAWENASN